MATCVSKTCLILLYNKDTFLNPGAFVGSFKNFIYLLNAENGEHIILYTPNVYYSWRTAALTSKVAFYIFIQQI